MLAEDDTQVREMITDSLTSAGYQVLPAASGEEALKRARQHGGAIDLLLTDVLMPGISGRQLAERLLRERPLTEVLYMSGYAEDSVVRHGVLEEGVTLLPKPLTPQRLIDAIEQVLGGGAVAGKARM